MNELNDFGWAVAQLKGGKKVCRTGWNGKGMWLEYYQSPKPEYLPWIRMKTVEDKFVPWLASQTDVLAEDWVLV